MQFLLTLFLLSAFYGIWTFDTHTFDEPVYPPPIDAMYGETVLRGVLPMLPAAEPYTHAVADHVSVQGGYYCKTPENLPILGPVPHVDGLFVCGALSGFGIMSACAAGELVATHVLRYVVGDAAAELPQYAEELAPGRYLSEEYLEKMRSAANARNGQL